MKDSPATSATLSSLATVAFVGAMPLIQAGDHLGGGLAILMGVMLYVIKYYTGN